MKKNLLLYILLAFLVVMNGFFLFKHFSTTDQKRPERRGPSDFIAKQLKFDDPQTKQFQKLDAKHRMKMEAIQEDIKVSKDVLFDKISDQAVPSSTIDSLAAIIAKKETGKELEIFYFLKSIGDLCNEDQKARFESIIRDALHPPGRREGNRPPGRPGGEDRPPPPPEH